MKLLFLGVSSALTMGDKKYQSNMLLQANSQESLLIDCGSDIRHSLYEQGINPNTINAIYISHLHADHVGGLEWFAFSKFFAEQEKPALFISPDQQDRLWNNVLSGGMLSLETVEANLATYFKIQPIKELRFQWENHLFQLIKTPHSISNYKQVPAYGLVIKGDSKTIFISTDTRFCPDVLNPIYEQVDLIFHDCETTQNVSGQHARYEELNTLDLRIKNKMWLYDYDDVHLPSAEKDGFLGFVEQGQSFIF